MNEIYAALTGLYGHIKAFIVWLREFCLIVYNFIINFSNWVDLDRIANYFQGQVKHFWFLICNRVFDWVGSVMLTIAGMLPEFPDIAPPGSIPIDIIKAFNWIFPMEYFLTCLGIFAVSSVAWVTVGVIGRWAKLWT